MSRTSNILIALLLLLPLCARAAEVHSNGAGGGRWSDSATWRGGKVPGPDDDAVLAARDHVIFDRDDSAAISCNQLFIDPHAVLSFYAGEQPSIMRIAGAVESYGAIRIDTTQSPRAMVGLHLVADAERDRLITMMAGSSLLIYGHESPAGGEPNVQILSGKDDASRGAATIKSDGGVMVDLKHAMLRDVEIRLANIDNTGYRANQRLNLVSCTFTGQAHIDLSTCDTPTINDNTFTTELPVPAAAVRLAGCSLAQMRGNKVVGPFDIGFDVNSDTDSSLNAADIRGTRIGVTWNGANGMMENLRIASGSGFYFRHASGIVNQCIIESANPFHADHSTMQISNLHVQTDKTPAPILTRSTLTLINTNLEGEHFKKLAREPHYGRPWVVNWRYVVVQVPGAPIGTLVELRSKGLKREEGVVDTNVRNSPAGLSPAKLTPLPVTGRAIMVKTWTLANRRNLEAAPDYDITLWTANPDGTHAPGKTGTLEAGKITFRADLTDATPTVEVQP